MRKVNDVDLAGLNDFFDTAQANMKKNAALPSHKSTDDIIRLAIECQLVTTGNRDGIYMDALVRFAELVAAAEREACAQEVQDLVDQRIPASEYPDLIRKGGA